MLFRSPFYKEYFGNGYPCAYEWMAVEWVSGLLMQLVAIAGGRLDVDDFEDCEYVDFYGVHLLLDQLAIIAEGWETLPFQKIAQIVSSDLQRARNSIHTRKCFNYYEPSIRNIPSCQKKMQKNY